MTKRVRLVDLIKVAERRPGKTGPDAPPAAPPVPEEVQSNHVLKYHWAGCGSCPVQAAMMNTRDLDDAGFARAIRKRRPVCGHCVRRWKAAK